MTEQEMVLSDTKTRLVTPACRANPPKSAILAACGACYGSICLNPDNLSLLDRDRCRSPHLFSIHNDAAAPVFSFRPRCRSRWRCNLSGRRPRFNEVPFTVKKIDLTDRGSSWSGRFSLARTDWNIDFQGDLAGRFSTVEGLGELLERVAIQSEKGAEILMLPQVINGRDTDVPNNAASIVVKRPAPSTVGTP